MELLMELMEENIENGNKMLVFSQFTSFLKIVEKELRVEAEVEGTRGVRRE